METTKAPRRRQSNDPKAVTSFFDGLRRSIPIKRSAIGSGRANEWFAIKRFETLTEFKELIGFEPQTPLVSVDRSGHSDFEVHGTTVLALRFKGGVLNLADRRATAGNLIMYDQAEKVIALDDFTVVSISGAFAKSVEICRMLKHSFKYYRRSVLHEMSLEGKLTEISRALAGNAPMAMQGIGLFLPIVSAFDVKRKEFGVYFFDGAGARFQNGSYACAGSGSERIRGIFELYTRTLGPFETRPFDEVLKHGLLMLDIAAQLDSATGGFSKTLPIARVLDQDGNRPVDPGILQKVASDVMNGDLV